MKVLACIPLLESPTAAPPCEAPAQAEDVSPAARPTSRRRRQSGRFPLASVAILAALAVLAWSLATSNDARRLQQQRLARMQPAPTTGTVAR